MASDAWEIDIEQLTLDDLEILEKGIGPGASAKQIKQTLGRLITNKTAKDIGKIPLKELNKRIAALSQTIQELSVPKESATPS